MKRIYKTSSLIIIFLSVSFFFFFTNSSLGYPNDLSINDPNSDIVLETNNNGSYDAKIEGNGEYSTKKTEDDLFFADKIYENLIPNYDYGTTTLTISPEYAYKSETLINNQWFSNEFKIPLKADYYSDLEINLSRIEYTTIYDDYGDVVGVDAQVHSNNPYPEPIYETWDGGFTTPQTLGYYDSSYTTFEDKQYLHLGAWAEARSFYPDIDSIPNGEDFPQYWDQNYIAILGNPIVNVSVEIAVEIINLDGSLNYQNYWDLIDTYYRITLECISDSRIGGSPISPYTDKEIIIANESYWEASLMYRQSGINQKYIFDSYYEDLLSGDGIITVDDILWSPPDRNPDNTPTPLGSSLTHWEFDNRSIGGNPAWVSEQLFNDYATWKGYSSNYGNPIIVFKFEALGMGFNPTWVGDEYGNWGYPFWWGTPLPTDPEDFNRGGGVGGFMIPPNLAPPTCWAKIKITEFDSKHQFEWRENHTKHYNNASDVLIEYYDGNDWVNNSIDYYGYEKYEEGWNNRLPIDSVHNFTKLITDPNNLYESMNVKIKSFKAILYEKIFQPKSALEIKGISMTRNSQNWSITASNLTNEVYFSKNSTCSKIMLDLNISSWDILYSSYLGYLYRYCINFSYFYIEDNFDYKNGYGNYTFNSDTSYYRNINITWTNLTLLGNYLKLLYINHIPNKLFPTYLGYDVNDTTKWRIEAYLNNIWGSGSSSESILFEYYLDNISPMISDYTIHNELNFGETKEFNISGNDDLNIFEAFIIFENNTSHQRISFILAKKPFINTYYKDIKYSDLNIGFYNVWYGLQDIAGNFNTTQSFILEVLLPSPSPFNLSTTSILPDDNGFFQIIWTTSENTDNYTIYQYHKCITEINGSLVKIDEVLSYVKTYFFASYLDGTYYFIVLAQNIYGEELSNCLIITVERTTFILDKDDGKPKKREPAEDITWLWIVLLIGGIVGGGIGIIILGRYIYRRSLRRRGFTKIKFI